MKTYELKPDSKHGQEFSFTFDEATQTFGGVDAEIVASLVEKAKASEYISYYPGQHGSSTYIGDTINEAQLGLIMSGYCGFFIADHFPYVPMVYAFDLKDIDTDIFEVLF